MVRAGVVRLSDAVFEKSFTRLARLASVHTRSGAGSGSLIGGAVGLLAERSFSPYAIAGATVLSLFAGIYGAWDLTLWNDQEPGET
jgi:hypothetical protein